MVIFDGEKLCVNVNRNNYKSILKIAEQSNNPEYFSDVSIYTFEADKKIAKMLFDLGFQFDSSAKIFLDRIDENNQKNEIIENKRKFDFYSIDKKNELFPFQKTGVKLILKIEGNVLLADEMGLGKTPQASKYLHLAENSLPALIICPASLKENWSREIKKWSGYDSYIINGKKVENLSEEFVKKYPVWIINYDILGFENEDDKKNELKRKQECQKNGEKYKKKILEVFGWCDEIIKHNFRTVIGDEVQYISEVTTLRARAVKKICSNLPDSKIIFISGTPYETKTSQFFSCLNILHPEMFPNEWKFKYRYCDPKKTFFGWTFDGLTNAEELHEKISRFMIRRFKKDVLTQLPPKMRAVVPLTISPEDRKIYDDEDSRFVDDIRNGKKDKKEQIGHISTLKKLAYQAKEKAVIQWIKDYLTFQNSKLVVFIWHHSTYDALMKEFEKNSVGVTGATPSDERQKLVDRFQNDEKINLFIGQIKASGVGLTLTKASATCFVEFGMTAPQHEQAEDRVHRIGQEADSVMAYYLILDNSVDTDAMNTLEKRNKNLKKVLNNEDNESMFGIDVDMNEAILQEYKKRKNI